MTTDKIIEVGIDDMERLYIKPEKEKFTLIWRSATGVHWDNKGFLYSPKPREWTYFDWYGEIVSVIETDCNCKLILTNQTQWSNVPKELKQQIIDVFLFSETV